MKAEAAATFKATKAGVEGTTEDTTAVEFRNATWTTRIRIDYAGGSNDATFAGFNPICVLALQTVAKANFLRGGKTDGGIMQLHIAAAGSNQEAGRWLSIADLSSILAAA